MSSELQALEEIFELLVALPEHERGSAVDRLCAGNPKLHEAASTLIRAFARSASSRDLVEPVDAAYVAAALDLEPLSQTPTHIGPYRIEGVLGEGGFGIVYLGVRDAPFHQQVAIKVLKPGMDSNAILARFAHERETLGLLTHPHIARILDAGQTERGYPYFVMDYVQGDSITHFAREQHLSIGQTIDILVTVGAAIQHAHSKGVIHRDIKPGNILVQRHHDQLTATVIDFGIAKVLSGDDRPDAQTAAQTRLGTPGYMSPEQAVCGLGGVDTRTDVYALGAVLFELLSGHPPMCPRNARQVLPGSNAAVPDDFRLQPPRFEDRPPHWPASTQAKFRGLTWIAMKALRTDPQQRYPSAADFIADLRACTAGLPLSAGPASSLYRLRTYARRHIWAVLAATALSVGLLGVALSLVFAARRERHLRVLADQAQQAAEERERRVEIAEREARRQGAIANLAAASALVEASDSASSRRRLLAVPADEWWWERGLIWSMGDDSLQSTRVGAGMIESLTASSDGAHIAVAVNSEDFTVLDAQTLRATHILPGGKGMRSVACLFHPVHPVLLTGAWDGTLRAYHVPSFRIQREMTFDSIDDLRCTADGRTIAYRQPRSREVVLLNYPELTEIARFGEQASDLAFLSDTPELVVAGGYRVCVVDFAGHERRSVEVPVQFPNIAVSPDCRLIAVAAGERVLVLSTESLETVRTFPHQSLAVSALFSPDGSTLATMGLGQSVHLWNLASGHLSKRLLTTFNSAGSALSLPSSREFLSGASDGAVVRWSVDSPGWREFPKANISALSLEPGGSRLLANSWKSGLLYVIDSASLGVLRTIDTGWSRVDKAFFADPDTLVIAGTRGAASVDIRSGQLSAIPVPGTPLAGANMLPLPEGRFVFGFPDQTPCIIDPVTRAVESLAAWRHSGVPIGVSPTGRLIALIHGDSVIICERTSGVVVCEVADSRERVHNAVFSPDETAFAVARWGGPLRIYRVDSASKLAELTVSDSPVFVAFRPDGRRLMITDIAGYLRVFDTSDYSSVLDIRVGTGWVQAALSSDAHRLAVIDVSGMLRCWSIPASTGGSLLWTEQPHPPRVVPAAADDER